MYKRVRNSWRHTVYGFCIYYISLLETFLSFSINEKFSVVARGFGWNMEKMASRLANTNEWFVFLMISKLKFKCNVSVIRKEYNSKKNNTQDFGNFFFFFFHIGKFNRFICEHDKISNVSYSKDIEFGLTVFSFYDFFLIWPKLFASFYDFSFFV